ncbi:MAG TPA: glycosyltransferase family 4 protein [Terracidiphilus sp.]|jgi:glycosyltransferase involved in cell wall biosynthesis
MVPTNTSNEKRPLRVLFFDLNDPFDHLNWSGTPAQIIRCLKEAGAQVTVLGPNFLFIRKSINWIIHRYYRYVRKRFYHIDRDLFWVRLFTRLSNRRLRAETADAIVTAFPAFTSFLQQGLPIFMIHDATWGQVLESYPWFRVENQPPRIVDNGFELEKITYRRKDVYPVLTSAWAADRAEKDYGADPDRISILPLGPNLMIAPGRPELEAALRCRGKGPCRLLFIGKEWLRKGGPSAVKAAAALIKAGIPAELHVVGPAELKPQSSAAADLPSFVRLHGFLSKSDPHDAGALKKLYLESDFFILPTLAEALGVVFAEAAAHGLPSLGTSVGGVPSVLHDGVDGAIFSPDDPAHEMALWIKRHYLDRSSYEALAWRARSDYEVRLSSLAYGTQLARIIRNTIDSNACKPDLPGESLAQSA